MKKLKVQQSFGEFLYTAAIREDRWGRVFICGKCREGNLGESPETRDACPNCGAIVEEVIRESSRR